VILFFDTSALMKLYAQEPHSDWTRQQVTASSHCAVSQITWVEMCAAFALKERTAQITAVDAKLAMHRFKTEWSIYTRLALDSAVLNTAGDFAIQFGLRAYDSVQLATARVAHQQLGNNMAMCCFDNQLNGAAGKLGIPVLGPQSF
jgi:predicted nucleic acid-binding protein